MRIAFVVLAGLIGWLWFAARAPAPTPAPAKLARRADLGNLHAQVAAATGREATISAGFNQNGAMAEMDEPDEAAEARADDERTADLAGLAAQLAEAEARDVEDPTDVPTEDDTIGHEVIQIVGSAPIIDIGTIPSTIEVDYIVDIPVSGRTFESVLGAAADSQGQDDGITISSGPQIENTYIIDEDMGKDLDPDSEVPNSIVY